MENIRKLPDDIINEIYSFVSIDTLSTCNKLYWRENYITKCKNIPLNRSYYRFLIRNDYYFIFKHYFQYYFNVFLKKKKIRYNAYIFDSYLDLLRHISLNEYNSKRCYNEIIEYSSLNGIGKKKYKNIKIRCNKWSN